MRQEFAAYLALIGRMATETINRGENDLSSRLARVLESLGLYTVLDTGGGADRRGRPDISCYVDEGGANLVTAADVVVEAKKPNEVGGHPNLTAALVDPEIWSEKFVRYVRAHAQQVSFFVLTSFERFLAVPITATIRAAAAGPCASEDETLKEEVQRLAMEFDLRDVHARTEWVEWSEGHLSVAALRPPPLSTTLNLTAVADVQGLEHFAETLADIVAGKRTSASYGAALVSAIEPTVEGMDDLDRGIRNSLFLHTIAQHPGATAETAADLLASDFKTELAGFVAASVHSLVGRLFAFKTIEDCFGPDDDVPLIERELRIFDTDRYDALAPDALAPAMFEAMHRLAEAGNPVIRGLAADGRFYDWIATEVDPAAFRRLVAHFFAHDLEELDGDLLGRFFEIYSQRVNRRLRKERGQYHTPMPIVGFMWRWALSVARDAGGLDNLIALDPGVGSAAFLVEGVRQLDDAGIPRFWERLYGFDIDAQVLGAAQTNLYLAILGRLSRAEADEVGELRLYPTDALDPTNGTRLRQYLPLYAPGLREFLTARIELSEQVKRANRFDLVIGNPPYLNNSNRTLAQVANAFPRLLATSRANARAKTRNIRDDYAWFFAAADYYIKGSGLICFVVSDSFCYARSYQFFRLDVLRLYKVHGVVRLGAGVFADVGPRTTFVLILLERLPEPRRPDEPPQAFGCIDLAPLALAADPADLGTEDDPRLRALAGSPNGIAGLPAGTTVTPSAGDLHAFYPIHPVVARVRAAGPHMHEVTKGESRFFLKKWPGLLTAFDDLLRGDTRTALDRRMRTFLTLAAPGGPTAPDSDALREFAHEHGLDQETVSRRLFPMMLLARQREVRFEEERVRRALSGNAPDEADWYPDADQTTWIYYEPRLTVPRNLLEGKDPGYGTMTQWRGHNSHQIVPKLAYTSSANPSRGLKAFVLHDTWLVKLHGGQRQQFNYTGLENSTEQRRLDGVPNNLGVEASGLWRALEDRGRREDDLLFYVASLYNSETARLFMAAGGRDLLNIPTDLRRIDIAVVERLADAGRSTRDLRWLEIGLARDGRFDAPLADELFGADRELLGLVPARASNRRFRAEAYYVAGEETEGRIIARLEQLRAETSGLVEDLFWM